MPFRIEDFGDRLMEEASDRFYRRIDRVERTLRLIATGRAEEADTPSRVSLHVQRGGGQLPGSRLLERARVEYDDIGLEALLGPSNDILSIEFLEAGLLAAKSVGRINKDDSAKSGTGFHVGLGVVMTNHHVCASPDEARACRLEMNAEDNQFGPPKRLFRYRFDPEKFFFTNANHDLSLIAVGEPSGAAPQLNTYGWHVPMSDQGKVVVGGTVNIVQHPDGANKSIVVHNSHLLDLEDGVDDERFCWYSGDTKDGSSGAPVFNNRWELVALHHKSIPRRNSLGEVLDRNGRVMSEVRARRHPEEIRWIANEGIRASKIIHAIENGAFDRDDHRSIRDSLINLWRRPSAHGDGQAAADV